MRLPQFEHVEPKSFEEACSFLAAHGASAWALAGGTDLLVKMKHRKIVPRYVVNLKAIAGQDYITYDETDGVRIGPLVTLQALKNSVTVKRQCKILAQSAAVESSVQIRNLATLGGNIANASPAADAPLALIVAGASVVLTSVGGRREVLLEEFFTAPGKTILEPGDLITEIRVPPVPPRTGVAFVKHSLRRTDIAIVAAAVMLTLSDNICTSVKIGLGSVAPTILRSGRAEAVLAGKTISDDVAEEAAQFAAEDASPIDDIRRTAKYRRRGIVDVTKFAILQALQDARTGGL